MVESQIPVENLKDLQDLALMAPNGAIVEVGVYKGGSAYALSMVARGRPLHLFDTFKGIPEKGPGDAFDVGSFGDVDISAVKALLPYAHFHIGVFPQTLGDEPQAISFAHIDCDQGGACESAIKLFWPRMVEGAIIAFDDYRFKGITRAIHSFFKDEQIKFTPNQIPYVIKGEK